MRTVSTNTCSSVSFMNTTIHCKPTASLQYYFYPLPSKDWGEDNRLPQPSPLWSQSVPSVGSSAYSKEGRCPLEKTAEILATAPLI